MRRLSAKVWLVCACMVLDGWKMLKLCQPLVCGIAQLWCWSGLIWIITWVRVLVLCQIWSAHILWKSLQGRSLSKLTISILSLVYTHTSAPTAASDSWSAIRRWEGQIRGLRMEEHLIKEQSDSILLFYWIVDPFFFLAKTNQLFYHLHNCISRATQIIWTKCSFHSVGTVVRVCSEKQPWVTQEQCVHQLLVMKGRQKDCRASLMSLWHNNV